MLDRQRTSVSLELQFAGLQSAATCPRSDRRKEERTSGCLQAKDVTVLESWSTRGPPQAKDVTVWAAGIEKTSLTICKGSVSTSALPLCDPR